MIDELRAQKYFSKQKPEKIVFLGHVKYRSGMQDLSYADDGSVLAWKKGTTVFVGATGKAVKAPEDIGFLFCGLDTLKEIDANRLDTSAVRNMCYLFYDDRKLEKVHIEEWNTENTRVMCCVFFRCVSIRELDLHKWDVSNVTDASGIFCTGDNYLGNGALEKLNLDSWSPDSLVKADSMFYGCGNLTELNVADWNMSKVITVNHMFADCFSLKILNVSKWDMSSCRDFDAVFNDCRSLTVIDVSKWDFLSATRMSQMFERCTSVQSIHIRMHTVQKCNDFGEIFNELKVKGDLINGEFIKWQ